MQKKSPIRSAMRLGGPALLLALTACAGTTPKMDAKFGDALQKSKQAQQIVPTAAQRQTAAPNATSAEVQRAVTIQNAGIPGATGAAAPAASTGTSTGTASTVR